MSVMKALDAFSSTQITTSTTTQIWTKPSGTEGSAVLHRVVVAIAGALSPTITVYDNTATTGTPIFACAGDALQSVELNIRCDAGIRVVTATGTPGTYYIVWV